MPNGAIGHRAAKKMAAFALGKANGTPLDDAD
jgi:hypothetical protein